MTTRTDYLREALEAWLDRDCAGDDCGDTCHEAARTALSLPPEQDGSEALAERDREIERLKAALEAARKGQVQTAAPPRPPRPPTGKGYWP